MKTFTKKDPVNGDIFIFDENNIESPIYIEFKFSGTKCWLKDNYLHRLDGPAKIMPFSPYQQWWIDGEQINCFSQEEFERIIKLKAFL